MNLKYDIAAYPVLKLTLSMDLKYGEHAESTILCAEYWCPSQATVTSTKSSSSLSDWKAVTSFTE